LIYSLVYHTGALLSLYQIPVAQSLLTNIVGGAVAADKYRGTFAIFPCSSHGRIVKLISNSGGAVAADKYRGRRSRR